jgi:hypothetical protein
MPTFAECITPLDRRIAAHASGSGTRYGTRLSLRVGHGSEGVAHRSRRVVYRSPFVATLSEHLPHPETEAGMRSELRVLSSLLLSHAAVFVGMSDAIGAMRCARTTDAPRRPSALPRTRRASVRVARPTVRTRNESPPVPPDVPAIPRDTPPASRHVSRLPRHVPPAPCDTACAPRHAPRVRRASPPEATDAPPVLRASRRARGHPERTPRGAPRARGDSMCFRVDYFTRRETT